ncbi:MAG TPA: hypothetical protein DCL21_01295 [Alphaproteobacteria bacterium]|nr:hypothetical protein [Alphaproteobacteria bacterium]
MKKILIIAMLLVSTSANAFYTTFEHDIERLREGVYKQQGTIAQKEAFLQKIIPLIKQRREEAYLNIASACAGDAKKLCPKAPNTIDAKVKCVSEKQTKISNVCKFTIRDNFRKK